MRIKWKKMMMIFAMIVTLFSIGTNVRADDDDHKHDDDDHNTHEYYQGDHDDDEKEEENHEDIWEGPQSQTEVTNGIDYWNIWSRKTTNTQNNSLPVNQPGELTVKVGANETTQYFIPQDGQLLISADAITGILGATITNYPQSKIAVITNGTEELIIRAGSNAVYENKVKTPMPIQAVSYEKSIYLPISVVANALGYRVTWDENKQVVEIQSI